MGWQEINKSEYIEQLKKNFNLKNAESILEKDLLLTLILAEFEKQGLGKELIFKGGTLLSRNYLNYHRFSEDIDFVFKDSNSIRKLKRSTRERKVKTFLDSFVPKLKEIADNLGLDFSTNRSDKKYCKMLSGRTVYTFKMYYENTKFVKIEINFIEKVINKPIELSIKAITDFFDSKEFIFILALKPSNFKVLSYPIEEIILEKYRAVLTRKNLQERDLFDLFLIKDSIKVNTDEVVDKIKASSLIKKELNTLIQEKLRLLEQGIFFRSEEKIKELSIAEYNEKEFEEFKKRIEPLLIKICNEFLKEK